MLNHHGMLPQRVVAVDQQSQSEIEARVERAAQRERERIEQKAKQEAQRIQRDAERKAEVAARERKARLERQAEIREQFEITPIDELRYTPGACQWLINGLLPRTGVAVLYGKPKVFKTFVVLDLAWAVAGGRNWAQHATGWGGNVFYIALEDKEGVRMRLAAYKATFKPDPEREEDPDYSPPLWLMTRSIDFGRAESPDVDTLVDAFFTLIRDNPVAIVIDTLSRTLKGAKENADGMSNFIDNAQDLADRLDCLVLVIHHEGTDERRPRGHTSLPAGVWPCGTSGASRASCAAGSPSRRQRTAPAARASTLR